MIFWHSVLQAYLILASRTGKRVKFGELRPAFRAEANDLIGDVGDIISLALHCFMNAEVFLYC